MLEIWTKSKETPSFEEFVSKLQGEIISLTVLERVKETLYDDSGKGVVDRVDDVATCIAVIYKK